MAFLAQATILLSEQIIVQEAMHIQKKMEIAKAAKEYFSHKF